MAKCTLKFVLAFLLAVCLAAAPLLGFQNAGISGLLTDNDLVVTNELADGQAIIYSLSDGSSEESDATIDESTLRDYARLTSEILHRRLESLGLRDSRVTVISADQVAVVLPYNSEAVAIDNTIGKRGKIEFKTSDAENAAAILTSDDVEAVAVTYHDESSTSSTNYDLVFHLTDSGMAKYTEATETATSEGTGDVYIYLDGEKISSLSIDEAVTENNFTVGTFTQNDAATYAVLLNSGEIPTDVSSDTVYATALNGGSYTGLFIGLAICAVLVCAYFVFRFKLAGFGAAISVIAALGAGLLLVDVFGLSLGLTGAAAFFIVGFTAFISNFVILREAAQTGSAPRAAVRKAFSNKKMFVADAVLLPLAVAIGMMFYGNIFTAMFSDLLFISTLTTSLSLALTYLTVSGLSDANKSASALGN